MCSRRHIQEDKNNRLDREAFAVISFSFVEFDPEPFLPCNTNPHHLVAPLITALEGSITQSKAEMKINFFEVEKAIKIKLCKLLEQLKQRRNRAETVMDFVDDCIVNTEEQDISTQFLQTEKDHLFDLREHF